MSSGKEILSSMHGPFYNIRKRILEKELRNSEFYQKNILLLDAGCGTGEYITFLKKFGVVMGLDINCNNIKIASEKHKHNFLIHLNNCSIEFLPLNSNIFDVIICLAVLEHIPNDIIAIKEIQRILSPKGLLLLNVPKIRNYEFQKHIDKIRLIINKHLKSEYEVGEVHVREGYNERSINELLKSNNFKIIKIIPFFGPFIQIYFIILESLFHKLLYDNNKLDKQKNRMNFIIKLARFIIWPISYIPQIIDLFIPKKMFFELFIIAQKKEF